MKTPVRAAVANVVAVASLLLASIASAASSPSAGVSPTPAPPDAPVTGSPGRTCAIDHPECDDMGLGGGLGAPSAQPATPKPGMVGVRPQPFTSATVGDDDVTVTVTYWTGVEPCVVLDHVDVAYGSSAVTITLFVGSDPTAGNVACPEIAALRSTLVTLDEPLAGRSLVDGAKP
jgi:hypothetical protein